MNSTPLTYLSSACGDPIGLSEFSSRTLPFNALDVDCSKILLCHLQIVVALQIHPEFRAVTEIQAQSECSIGRNAPTIVDNLGNSVWRNADSLRQFILRKPVFYKEFFFEHFTGGDRCERILGDRLLQSMIVNDLN